MINLTNDEKWWFIKQPIKKWWPRTSRVSFEEGRVFLQPGLTLDTQLSAAPEVLVPMLHFGKRLGSFRR